MRNDKLRGIFDCIKLCPKFKYANYKNHHTCSFIHSTLGL